MTKNGIDLDQDKLKAICLKHEIQSLFVFGSVLRDDFGPASDVDFLVRLQPHTPLRIERLLAIEEELSQAIGRPVDIVLGSEIDSPDANPYRRQHILNTMEPVCVA